MPAGIGPRNVYILIGLLYVDTKTYMPYKLLLSTFFNIQIKWKGHRKKINHKKCINTKSQKIKLITARIAW